ncbi:UNVERIFIED_CONTAM: hypothetical protein NCL1_41722 [Trichonephila clavipes]
MKTGIATGYINSDPGQWMDINWLTIGSALLPSLTIMLMDFISQGPQNTDILALSNRLVRVRSIRGIDPARPEADHEAERHPGVWPNADRHPQPPLQRGVLRSQRG